MVTETKEQETPLTAEQIKQRKSDLMDFWTNEIPFMEKQKQYQQLATELEELRARYVRAQIMIAQALAPAPEQAPEDLPDGAIPANAPPTESPKERKLKKVPTE